MFDFWKTDLTEEETDALLDKAAQEVSRRHLEAPAIVALELHKPLSNVGAHGMMTMAPFLVPFLGFEFVNNYSRLFSKRENVEKLLLRIEAGRPASGTSTEDSCQT